MKRRDINFLDMWKNTPTSHMYYTYVKPLNNPPTLIGVGPHVNNSYQHWLHPVALRGLITPVSSNTIHRHLRLL